MNDASSAICRTDRTEGLRLLHLAAAQGHPEALYTVGVLHQYGNGVAADVAEAIRWYRRAQKAGSTHAALKLQEFGRVESFTLFNSHGLPNLER